jgi:beta-glucanase (GH16 family)
MFSFNFVYRKKGVYMKRNRKCAVMVAGMFFLILHLCMSVSSAQESSKKWNLVFSDEFNDDGQPDQKKWSYEKGCTGWGNGEVQCYTADRAENARVENGKLILEARRDGSGQRQYTSARLTTKEKAQWTYGRVEVCAKLPSGRGIWPAIWMLPTKWLYGANYWPDNGEIDIMEYVGYAPGQVHASIHTFQHNFRKGNPETKTVSVADAEQSFHVYAIEWYPERIDFFVDHQKYFTVFQRKNNYRHWPFNKDFYLLLNVAVGGRWGGRHGIDASIFPQRMEIDYVRVYQ